MEKTLDGIVFVKKHINQWKTISSNHIQIVCPFCNNSNMNVFKDRSICSTCKANIKTLDLIETYCGHDQLAVEQYLKEFQE